MRIVRIEVSNVRVDLSKPYIMANFKEQGMTNKSCVVLRTQTDNGLWGIGESAPDPPHAFTYETPETVMQVIRDAIGPAVLGTDPRNLVALHAKMDSVLLGWPFAKAPFDVAAYDLLGQALDVPVYQLLGGQLRDRVPVLWPVGGDTPERNAQEVIDKLQEGYRSFHVKLGALSPEQDVARVAAIRAAVGSDVPLMVDVNQGWDRTTALRTIRQLDEFNLSMIEQPVPAWDLEGMAQIQAATHTPISADEVLHSTHDAIRLIRHDAARVFSLKTGKCGGLFRTRQIAAMAEAAGLPCFINSMIEMGISVAASLHLAAGIPNLVDHGHALMSHLRIQEDILRTDSFEYDGKDILVPTDCAGLGVEIDEEKLERRTLDRFVLEL